MIRLFHITDTEFERGDTLLPQPDGYVHFPESRALEAILERYRPTDKLPRGESVFFVKEIPSSGDEVGADGSDWIVTCALDADTLANQSDLNWIRELDQGFEHPSDLEECFSEKELRLLAHGYWSGKARPGHEPRFEYRAPSAVVACVSAFDSIMREAEWSQVVSEVDR